MKKVFLFLLMGMFMLSFASAVPPFQSNEGTTSGLQIFSPDFTATKYNTTFNLHLHVSNISNGVQFSNTAVDCYIHLYNMAGSHIFEGGAFSKDSNGFDLEQSISYGNFTEAGEYNAYYIWCNNTAQKLGGEVKGTYQITSNGQPSPEGIVIVGFCFVLLLILGYSVVMIVKAVGHIIDKNFDLMDVAIMWGMFFGLLGLNQLASIYLGNVIVNNWLDLFVKLYAFPMVIVPLIAFFLSLFSMNKEKKRKAKEW